MQPQPLIASTKPAARPVFSLRSRWAGTAARSPATPGRWCRGSDPSERPARQSGPRTPRRTGSPPRRSRRRASPPGTQSRQPGQRLGPTFDISLTEPWTGGAGSWPTTRGLPLRGTTRRRQRFQLPLAPIGPHSLTMRPGSASRPRPGGRSCSVRARCAGTVARPGVTWCIDAPLGHSALPRATPSGLRLSILGRR